MTERVAGRHKVALALAEAYRITYDEALPYALRAVRDRGRDESLEVYVRYCWKWLGK
jgi:hypothetical protein